MKFDGHEFRLSYVKYRIQRKINGKNNLVGKQSTAEPETMPMTVIAGLSYASPSVQCCFKQAVNAGFFSRTFKSCEFLISNDNAGIFECMP